MDQHQVNTAWKQISIQTKMACGAREATSTTDGKLQFKVDRRPYRFVEVSLTALDLYDVEYFRVKRGSFQRVSLEQSSGLYADMLSETIYHMVNK